MLLEDIHTVFEDRNVVFLHGMAGIGKSELARQYWRKYKDLYNIVVFARYDNSLASLISDDKIFNIEGTKRKIKEGNVSQTDEEYALDKLSFLKSFADEHTLIIIDNFDVSVKEDPFFEEVVSVMNCHILVTTRCEPDKKKYHVIPVGEIDDETLKDLFIQYANPPKTIIEVDDPDFEELFRLTNRHTYTLELVAKFMEENDNIDYISEMIEFLKEHDFSDIEIGGYDNICKLFRFTSLDDNEKYFLRCLSMMPPTGISQKLFKKWIGSGFIARSRLVDLSLVKIDGEARTISLHPVVREVILNELNPSYENCKDFLDLFTKDLYDYISWNYPVSHKKFLFECCKGIRNQIVTITENNFNLFFHMTNFGCFVDSFENNIESLQHIGRVAQEIFGDSSAWLGKIFHRLRWCYFAYGNYQKALNILETKAFFILEEFVNEAPGEYIHCCCDIAKLLFKENAKEDANQYLQKAFGVINDNVLSKIEIVQYRSAMVYTTKMMFSSEQGNYDDALGYCERAMSVVATLKYMELDQAAILTSLEKIYIKKEKYTNAIVHIQSAIQIYEKYSGMLNASSSHGERHCGLYVDLSLCYEKINDIESAKMNAEEAYKIASKIYQEGHPVFAIIKSRYSKF